MSLHTQALREGHDSRTGRNGAISCSPLFTPHDDKKVFSLCFELATGVFALGSLPLGLKIPVLSILSTCFTSHHWRVIPHLSLTVNPNKIKVQRWYLGVADSIFVEPFASGVLC